MAHRSIIVLSLAGLLLAASAAYAADVLSPKNIGMDLARDLANEAVKACRKNGYPVSAVVVDRHGIVRAVLRDDLAKRFTLQIAEQKANAALMGGVPSSTFRKRRSDIRQEMNHVRDILMMEGGVLISSGGFNIGALGVSGAPGGDKDETCANQAVKALEERLAFAGE